MEQQRHSRVNGTPQQSCQEVGINALQPRCVGDTKGVIIVSGFTAAKLVRGRCHIRGIQSITRCVKRLSNGNSENPLYIHRESGTHARRVKMQTLCALSCELPACVPVREHDGAASLWDRGVPFTRDDRLTASVAGRQLYTKSLPLLLDSGSSPIPLHNMLRVWGRLLRQVPPLAVFRT